MKLTEKEWALIDNALHMAREQWKYDHGTMTNTGQHRLAGQFLTQYLDAGELITKLANREE